MRARVACRLCDPESEVCKKLFENLDNADSIVSEIEFLSMHLFLIIICTIAEARLPLTGYFETRTFAMQLYNKCDQMVSTLNGKLALAYVPTYLSSHVATCAWFWIVPNAVSVHARLIASCRNPMEVRQGASAREAERAAAQDREAEEELKYVVRMVAA